MIFSKSTKKRLKIFSLIAIAASVIFFFIYNNLQKNVVYFYAPQEIKNLTNIPSNKIRIGGLVKEGSIKKNTILMFLLLLITKMKFSLSTMGCYPIYLLKVKVQLQKAF